MGVAKCGLAGTVSAREAARAASSVARTSNFSPTVTSSTYMADDLVFANDPFANEALDFGDEVKSEKKKKETADSVQDNYIHIRVQQRNGRKSWTTVQGINPKINKKIILKECKKRFNCNGCIIEDPEHGDIVQLQGDQRKLVAQFLIDEKISKKALIKVHGS